MDPEQLSNPPTDSPIGPHGIRQPVEPAQGPVGDTSARDLPTIEERAAAELRENIEKIVESRHDAPHRVLGAHSSKDGSSIVVRTFLPHASRVTLRIKGTSPRVQAMDRIHDDGLFEAVVTCTDGKLDYEYAARDGEGNEHRLDDPYAFDAAWFTPEDEERFVAGQHDHLHEKLGAHLLTLDGRSGARFAVWAPHAQRVSVIGTFNRWDGRCHPMRRLTASGIWDLFIPGLKDGLLYKFEIKTAQGAVFPKGDPFAFRTEVPPNSASIICDCMPGHRWRDTEWQANRRARVVTQCGVVVLKLDLDEPLGESQRADPESRPGALATGSLLCSIKEQGYTHVELFASSPGYLGSAGAFAPGEAYASPEQIMEFIDSCHDLDLGVIVPGLNSRFPQALPELAWFDGCPLYEAAEGEAPGNGMFATEKGEVRSFLLSHARFWNERYHADGWRTDFRITPLYSGMLRRGHEGLSGVRIIVREPASGETLSRIERDRLLSARHENPHSILGLHYLEHSRKLRLRALVPHGTQVCACFTDEPESVYELHAVHPDGLFELTLPQAEGHRPYRLRVLKADGSRVDVADPYAFSDFTFSDFDQHLFGAGNHYRVNEKLGAHPRNSNGVEGVGFSVWAPNAEGVSVVGPFNAWDGRCHQMRRHGLSGVWEIFVPELPDGALYKYEIRARFGHVYLKADPYALYAEVPPASASIVYRIEGAHPWRDDEWLERRQRAAMWQQPVSIYEVHLGSWMRSAGNEPLSYIDLAEKLIPYVKEMGFTHIELLPVAEHPYEPSWGYQVTGYYAPTSRLGRPEHLMHFVDLCHQNGIGVLLDWVSGHFPKDAHGLAWFDGTALYEHADPRKGEHRDWGTLIFNYGRHEVENFLIANARFWLERYHFDGLRVDAVASMLYLDYSRPRPGDWIPNKYGGRENLEAIEFLKHTNVIAHGEFPGVMMIAEESTAWPNVSRPVDKGGLGFGYKWNMGWMHDVLAYMSTPPEQRRHQHHKLTFGLVYAFAENYVLSLSHDEVVHMKRSLWSKMPGSELEKFANLRVLYAFMYGHPGKKLLFMGAEFGQRSEWDHSRGLDWHLLEQEPHRQLKTYLKNLNLLYRSEPAFFEVDFRSAGFEWLEVDNAEQSIIAFLRKARDPRDTLLFAMNFSAVPRPDHRIGVPYPCSYAHLFHSDLRRYGGAGDDAMPDDLQAEDIPWHSREFSIRINLPALSAVILKPAPFRPEPITARTART